MMRVTLHNLCKYFGDVKAVDGVNLEIGKGEFMALLGPSGCGKTTILLTIAGFYKPDKGEVRFNDQLVNNLPPRRRNIGMVFQSYALYPHMRVLDNIAFPLKLQKVPKRVWRVKAREVAELLKIADLLDRMPGQLSGGQQQRVALARALVKKPSLLLLDEPLSNLDAKLRIDMRTELKRLQKDLGITTIFVTHDQIEAMSMADRIAVLEAGKLQQVGTPGELYDTPANLFVAGFIGTPSMNFVVGELVEKDNQLFFISEGLRCLLPGEIAQMTRGGIPSRVVLGVRPEDVVIGQGEVEGEVYVVEPLGRDTLVTFRVGKISLKVLAPTSLKYEIGTRVKLDFTRGRLHLFAEDTGQVLLKG